MAVELILRIKTSRHAELVSTSHGFIDCETLKQVQGDEFQWSHQQQ